jgi:hypothetical protein
MKMYRNLLLIACCCLTVCLFPTAVQSQPGDLAEAAASAAGTNVSVSCAADSTVVAGLDDPLQLSSCFVSVECADGSTVSCNGNSSCATSGTNGRCVTCDGVEQACCALTACEQCENNFNACISTCQGHLECRICDQVYSICFDGHTCP